MQDRSPPVKIFLLRTAGPYIGSGPDPRFSYLDWICAHQARVLIATYSPQRPVTTRDGNVHQMAQLLRESVTGKQGTEAGLLKAVKQPWFAPLQLNRKATRSR
jgi:hypothetical protein